MGTPIFYSYAKWCLSGVNTWTVNLISAMQDTEFDSKVLFTGIPRSPQPELDEFAIPYDFLDVQSPRKRRREWRALKEFLEAHAPCIYINNFDFHRSCAVGTLSPEVRVVAVIHSDEECYYDELRRIGSNCNTIVCVSSDLTGKVKRRFPDLSDRVQFIAHGIPITETSLTTRPNEGPLRLCYCNRIQQYQKRVFDLPIIAKELERIGVDYELDIAGDGPDAEELRIRFDNVKLKCPVRFHGRITNATVMDLCRRSHLFLLTSDFEGLPISLLEAMSVGCVPVVYEIDSGIEDAIPSKDFGFIVPHGNTQEYAKVIQHVALDFNSLKSWSKNCAQLMRDRFSLNRMANDYESLFRDSLFNESTVRRTNQISVPYDISIRGRLLRRLKSLLPKLVAK
ncbi:MAG: glycosyltransferase family 4 protein [Pirellula sp.]